jgi:hypothetical protein
VQRESKKNQRCNEEEEEMMNSQERDNKGLEAHESSESAATFLWVGVTRDCLGSPETEVRELSVPDVPDSE